MTWLTRFFRSESPEPGVPSVHSVKFDTRGWLPSKAKGNALEWSKPDGDTLSSRIDAQLTPDRLPPMNLDALRALYRDEAADLGGGIVSADVVRVGQLPVIKVITKYERRPAYAYDGRLIVPLKNATCTITMHSIERGVTGTRDAVVGAQRAERGELEIEPADEPGAPGRVKGWFQDPYDPGRSERSLYSMSDDERLDALFPQHPLSKVRNGLAVIQGTLSVERSAFPDHMDSPSSSEGEPPQGARRLLSSGTVGSLYLMAGKFDVAEKVLADSVSSADDAGANDIRVARELLLLGLAQECQEKYVDAERSLSRSCGILRATVGEEDPNTAEAMNNLGRIYVCLDRHEEAEPLFRRALKVFREKALRGLAASR